VDLNARLEKSIAILLNKNSFLELLEVEPVSVLGRFVDHLIILITRVCLLSALLTDAIE
jgi:hypothetical protein